MDRGSTVNLRSIKTFNEIELKKNNIQTCGQYNIRSSTDTVQNCILGSIDLNMHRLMSDVNVNFANFAKSKCKFLVAAESVILDRIWLGIPFLKDHSIKMHFNKSNCKIMGSFQTEKGF